MKHTKRIGAAALAVLAAAGLCGFSKAEAKAPEKETIYQVGLLQSLTLGYYDGYITVDELKEHGDTGIGTFEGVNGEMIVLDGVVYQALGDGSVVEADADETVPFTTVTEFDADVTKKKLNAGSLDELRETLDAIVEKNGRNQFYMTKISGTCDKLTIRSELKQEKPYKPLNEALKTDQREFDHENISGTIVALYCPDYMDGLNTPGWHFHFISDDKVSGGHILSLEELSGKAEIDIVGGFEMFVPDTDDFNDLELSQSLEEAIKEVEG